LKLPPTKNWRAMAAIGVLESLGTGLESFFERISGDLWSSLLSKSLQPASLSVEPGEGGERKTPLPSSRHWALRDGFTCVLQTFLWTPSSTTEANRLVASRMQIFWNQWVCRLISQNLSIGHWTRILSSPAAWSPCWFASELFC
jgi:hypothetical protein